MSSKSLSTESVPFLINAATDLVDEGEPERALETCQVASGILDGQPASVTIQTYRGRTYQVQAEAYLYLYRLDQAVAAYARAEEAFRSEPELAEDHVRCLHDGALTFANVDLMDLARDYADRGLAAAASIDGPYVKDFRRLRLLLEDVSATNYVEFVERIRELQVSESDSAADRSLTHRGAQAIMEFGTPDEVRAALAEIDELYRGATDTMRQVTCLAPIAYLERDLQPVSDSLLGALEQVLAKLTDADEKQVRAEALRRTRWRCGVVAAQRMRWTRHWMRFASSTPRSGMSARRCCVSSRAPSADRPDMWHFA